MDSGINDTIMKVKEVFKRKQSNCGYNRAKQPIWLTDYGKDNFEWLLARGLLVESKRRFAGESEMWKYYEFTTIGVWLNEWYNNSLGDFLYYYVFHLYQFRIWWERLMIKFGKRYAWQEYEDVDLNDI